MTKEEIVKQLNLQPHPEGGFFKEVFRSAEEIELDRIGAPRNMSTSIYFLITSENFSAFHKIQQDEGWFFHMGSGIDLHVISPQGNHQLIKIGNDLAIAEVPQAMVPAHHWFAACVPKSDSFAFVSCTVAPGFDFDDFVLADREWMINEFPHHQGLITSFTRPTAMK